jgi:hypothetical protein
MNLRRTIVVDSTMNERPDFLQHPQRTPESHVVRLMACVRRFGQLGLRLAQKDFSEMTATAPVPALRDLSLVQPLIRLWQSIRRGDENIAQAEPMAYVDESLLSDVSEFNHDIVVESSGVWVNSRIPYGINEDGSIRYKRAS